MGLEAILTPLTYEQYRALPSDVRLIRQRAAEVSRRRWASTRAGMDLRKRLLRVGRCALCPSRERLTIDHIVPVVLGGTHDESNLRVLCGPCNSRKGAKA